MFAQKQNGTIFFLSAVDILSLFFWDKFEFCSSMPEPRRKSLKGENN